MKKRILIIGAGVSGLTLANELSSVAEVSVFEKARGVGGRMSTRYADPFSFDHGAPFFTAESELFKNFIQNYIQNNIFALWETDVFDLKNRICIEKKTDFYVAIPHMNNLCKSLSQGLNIHLNTEILPFLRKHKNGWHAVDKNNTNLGHYDIIISTAPLSQTRLLFAALPLQEKYFSHLKMSACHALMVGLNIPWKYNWEIAKVSDSPIQWIYLSSGKPGRDRNKTSLVLHTDPMWSDNHIDIPLDTIESNLLSEFFRISDLNASHIAFSSIHRWRYAGSDNKAASVPYFDKTAGIGFTGDWLSHARVEDAWLNAHKLAKQIIDSL
jgi:renalase